MILSKPFKSEDHGGKCDPVIVYLQKIQSVGTY